MSYKKIIDGFSSINLKEMRKEGFLKKLNEEYKQQISRVESKNGWKKIEKCPLCNFANKKLEFSKFGIGVCCCDNCSLRYLEKIPKKIQDICDDEAFLPESMKAYMENVKYRKERFGKERIRLIKSFVKKENIKLLDVGCGIGWFLETAKENGFEIYGQEISKELSKFTSKRIGIKIWNSLKDIGTNIKFDVITLFDVLEHIGDPVKFLENCMELLVDDGIFVIFTPNFDSLAIQFMKENSNLICPEHLIYFTYDSVKILAEKLNMKIMHYKIYGIDLGDLKSYYESIGKDKIAQACVELYPFIQPIIDESGLGNHMRFILRKKVEK